MSKDPEYLPLSSYKEAHLTFQRPDLADFLSPRSSAGLPLESLEKERKARRRLRTLLEEQADMNEILADENEILSVQQRSLLKLLITKDKQLDTFALTFKSLNCASSDTISALIALNTIAKIATKRLRLGFKYIENSFHSSSQTRHFAFVHTLERVHRRRLFQTFSSIKGNSVKFYKVLAIAIKAKAVMRTKEVFQTIKDENSQKSIQSFNAKDKVNSMIHCVNKQRMHCDSIKQAYNKWKCISRLGKFSKVLGLTNLDRSRKEVGFRKISEYCKHKHIHNEHMKNLEKINRFSKTFLNINILFSIMKKFQILAYQRSFNIWKSKNNTKHMKSAILLSSSLNRILKKRTNRLFHRKNNTLISLIRYRVHSVLSYAFNSCRAPDQLSGLKTETKKLRQKLQEKDQEVNKLTSKITKHLEDLDQFQLSNAQDREKIMLECSHTKAEIQRKEDTIESLEQQINLLQDKVREAEDDKRMCSLQIAQLQGNLTKAQQLYAQSMSEKSKVQSTELEYKKQLISLTATIDSMAEEKESLFERISTAETENRTLKRKMVEQKNSYEHLSEQLELHHKREEQYQQQMLDLKHSLEQESELKCSVISDKNNEITMMKEQFSAAKSQLEQLKREVEIKENQSDKDRIKKLMRENAQLSARMEEMQRQASDGKSTSSQLSSQVLKLNKELTDLKVDYKDRAVKTNKLAIEFENVNNQLAEVTQERDRLANALRNLQNDKNYWIGKSDNEAYEKRIAELQSELEECKLEAIDSRQEVAKVCAEIENYASILEAMEEKLLEAEERVKRCDEEKDEAIAEVKAIRQRYINIISS